VEPRRPAEDAQTLLVAGSFGIDVDRAAVARARFGFVEPRRGLRLVETGTFFELENALVQNRFWLPYQQRRELQAASLLAGSGAVARFVTTFSSHELNTGWTAPDEARTALIRAITPGDSAFRGWNAPIGSGAADYDVTDFADLRRAIAEGTSRDGPPVHVVMRPARADHLFRYNRVEGPFVGLAAVVEPRLLAERWWSLYGTGGWAFAEGTPRGEVLARFRPGDDRVGISAGLYRRLRDTQVFRPSIEADIMYSLAAGFGGTDLRDFYAVQGAELQTTYRQGALSLRGGGRWEQQDSVQRNTTRHFFGEAENFPPVAPAVPGRHAALEGEIRYGRGGGALGITNSWISSFRAETGVGDFRFSRAIGVVSARRTLGPLAVGARVDAGHVWGSAPSQYIFRFGGSEGLRGYDPNAFAGSSAVLGRGRAVAFLPFGNEPAAHFGPLMIPPIRPALVVSGDLGWTTISDATRDELFRLGTRTTDGVRPVVGLGLSFFEDALTAEWVRPLRPLEDQNRGWRFRFGLSGWY